MYKVRTPTIQNRGYACKCLPVWLVSALTPSTLSGTVWGMVKGTNIKEKLTTFPRAFFRSSLFRPVLLLVVFAIAGGISLTVTHGKPDPYASARKTADGFVQAYAACDSKAVQSIFLPFQAAGSQDATAYQQQCVKGVYRFTFVRQLAIAAKDQKGAKLKSVGYLYDLTSSRAKGTAQVVVDLEWNAATHTWLVFNLAPANNSNTTKP